MTDKEIKYVKRCIREDVHRFYTWGPWKEKRKEVLSMDKYECQLCKSRGKYTKATTVHHINHLKSRPDMALDIWYTIGGQKKRNLISLCHNCHEEVHGYRVPRDKKPMTEERWD